MLLAPRSVDTCFDEGDSCSANVDCCTGTCSSGTCGKLLPLHSTITYITLGFKLLKVGLRLSVSHMLLFRPCVGMFCGVFVVAICVEYTLSWPLLQYVRCVVVALARPDSTYHSTSCIHSLIPCNLDLYMPVCTFSLVVLFSLAVLIGVWQRTFPVAWWSWRTRTWGATRTPRVNRFLAGGC